MQENLLFNKKVMKQINVILREFKKAQAHIMESKELDTETKVLFLKALNKDLLYWVPLSENSYGLMDAEGVTVNASDMKSLKTFLQRFKDMEE